jgi:hypothetical protein
MLKRGLMHDSLALATAGGRRCWVRPLAGERAAPVLIRSATKRQPAKKHGHAAHRRAK